ncbi:MAG: M23 family metallopeptidase [Lachnospiraceae bacterium]|jgi:septal ring factor EnvC (AmiA/AmiB activator)|nr:M23 family metallopeptidase [Lachnospiraceae bacterium]
MQNKDGKKFTRKKGAMLILSLCLVGGAAFTTFYTMNRAEKAKEEQEQLVDLNEEARQEDAEEEDAAKATEQETDAQRVNNADAQADLPLANEMDVDPASFPQEEETDLSAEAENETEASVDASSANIQPTVAYDDSVPLTWPVAGNVVVDYSMDATVYFPTLDQYKYSPSLIIGADVGSQVVASTKGIVESVDVNEETGTTVTLNIGNNYELVYGQLKEVTVAVGNTVETGQLLGYVSEPTKYYCEEGSNLYFQVMKDGEPADPFLYLE